MDKREDILGIHPSPFKSTACSIIRASRLPEENARLMPLKMTQGINRPIPSAAISKVSEKSLATPDNKKAVFLPNKSAQIPLGSSKIRADSAYRPIKSGNVLTSAPLSSKIKFNTGIKSPREK
jgi:hypothetical protein